MYYSIPQGADQAGFPFEPNQAKPREKAPFVPEAGGRTTPNWNCPLWKSGGSCGASFAFWLLVRSGYSSSASFSRSTVASFTRNFLYLYPGLYSTFFL
jgi:hypothetical protein